MSAPKKISELEIIGSTEFIDVAGVKNVPAKIDTGADSSSIWASHIRVTKDGVLHFQLFDKKSPFYTGEDFTRTDFRAVIIRDASGNEQIRYRTHLSLKLHGKKIKALFNLANRSKNNFPILIGRRTISKKFLVDVSKKYATVPVKKCKTKISQKRLDEDPYKFHQEYIKLKKKGA